MLFGKAFANVQTVVRRTVIDKNDFAFRSIETMRLLMRRKLSKSRFDTFRKESFDIKNRNNNTQ